MMGSTVFAGIRLRGSLRILPKLDEMDIAERFIAAQNSGLVLLDQVRMEKP